MTTLKMMKKQELGVLVEFHSEFIEESENITTIGNKKVVIKTKTKKFSCGHQVTWFATDDWIVLRPLLMRLQEYFLMDTDKHAKMRLVALDECGEKSLKFMNSTTLGTKVCVSKQSRRKGQRLLDTELVEEIWISNDDYEGLHISNGSARRSILFRLNTVFNIRSGRHTSIKLEKRK